MIRILRHHRRCLATTPGPLRRGVAALEAAILLPLLSLLVFGTIELTDAIFIKQSLAVGAYEGARVASRAGSSTDSVKQRIDEVLKSRNVAGYTIVVSPDLAEGTPRGTQIRVLVQLPAGKVPMGPVQFFANRTLEHQVHMVRL